MTLFGHRENADWHAFGTFAHHHLRTRRFPRETRVPCLFWLRQYSMADADKPVQNDPYKLSGKTVSHYAVREVLGGGGMGVVYQAEDTRLQRPVALKFLPPALSQDSHSKDRFLAEAQAASALDHPNICTVHEFGETDAGQLFIAMAYYAGESLRGRFERGPLELDDALNFGIQVAKGLQAAHNSGIVHRDIKPANLVVTTDEVVKIVDFGIARVGEANLTQTGATVGTTGYMSPEQTRGDEVDGRADIWALGVVLYEAVTGVRPFRGNYDQAVVYAILHEEPKPAKTIRPELPDEIGAVIDRCLQKDLALRYPDTDALLKDLEAVRRGDAPERQVRLPKTTTKGRIRKTAMAALVLVSIVLATLFGRSLLSPGDIAAQGVIQVAVLPFINVSGDSTDQAFIDGLGYTVSATLTEMEQFEDRLSVLPADVDEVETLTPREAAESLNADVLVTGSVQRADNRVRLTLNLYDAHIDSQTRSAILDNESTNMLALQDSVAQMLAGLLDIELSASDQETLSAGGTSSPEAFDNYTRAQGFLLNYEDERNIDLAIQHFEQAIEADPRYVLAHAGLGGAYWRKFDASGDPVWMERAAKSSERAVELNPNLAPVHVAAGLVYKGTGRYDEAENEFLRALDIDSTNAFAHQQLAATYFFLSEFDRAETHYLRAIELKQGYWGFYNTLGYLFNNQGRHEEAARMYRRVIDFRPDSPAGYNNLGYQYLHLEMPDSARVWFQQAAEADPDATRPTAWAYANLGEIHVRRREFAEAVSFYERAVRLESAESDFWYFLAAATYWAGDSSRAAEAWQRVIELDTQGLEVNPNDANALIGLAFSFAMTGNAERGRLLLNRLDDIPTETLWIQVAMAEIAEQLGERDLALRYLEEGFSIGLTPNSVEESPWLDTLREDPDYNALIR